MQAVKAELTVSSIHEHGGLFRVECVSDAALPRISAGQFAHVKVPGKELRRPLCVYDNGEHAVTFIVARVGEGTAAFTSQKQGARFDALLPLGNGFPVLPDVTNVALLCGGTGCAPLYKIAKDNPSLNCTALLGFPTAAAADVYCGDFDKVCKRVCYCTDDGTLGYHGFPTELLTEIAPDVLYVCGAPGLMRTAQRFCADRGIVGFCSMEQRMGCGVGACLVCSVRVKRNGQEKLVRACADGPVFDISEILF